VSGRPSAAAFLAALALGVCLPGCREGGSTTAVSTVPAISILPDDPSQPYGITAIDYHFHDAHPTFPLAPSRTVTWTNDVPLGATIRIRDLGRKLGGPGTYTFFCAYHENLGMIGTIIIR
jgi:hypothetical protein